MDRGFITGNVQLWAQVKVISLGHSGNSILLSYAVLWMGNSTGVHTRGCSLAKIKHETWIGGLEKTSDARSQADLTRLRFVGQGILFAVKFRFCFCCTSSKFDQDRDWYEEIFQRFIIRTETQVQTYGCIIRNYSTKILLRESMDNHDTTAVGICTSVVFSLVR